MNTDLTCPEATGGKKPRKVKVTLSITKEAQDLMPFTKWCVAHHGYASARTMGDFISQLIVEYHQSRPESQGGKQPKTHQRPPS